MDPYTIEFRDRPSKKHKRLLPISVAPVAKLIRQYIINQSARFEWIAKSVESFWLIKQELSTILKIEPHYIGRALEELISEGMIGKLVYVPHNETIPDRYGTWKWTGKEWEQVTSLYRKSTKHPKAKRKVEIRGGFMGYQVGCRILRPPSSKLKWDGRGYPVLVKSEAFRKSLQENKYTIDKSGCLQEVTVRATICKRCGDVIAPVNCCQVHKHGRKHSRATCNSNIVASIMRS